MWRSWEAHPNNVFYTPKNMVIVVLHDNIVNIAYLRQYLHFFKMADCGHLGSWMLKDDKVTSLGFGLSVFYFTRITNKTLYVL